jgi:predicted DCC family thiol-disulfide oxidoreductase YuxK
MAMQPRLVLFDGVCGLCQKTVQFLVRHDRGRQLRYAPLQGDTAAALRGQYPQIPETLESVVFIEEGKLYLRSQAILRMTRYLGFPWRLGLVFGFLPLWLTDPIYNLVARMRYRLFGKSDVCQIPTPAERELFLP